MSLQVDYSNGASLCKSPDPVYAEFPHVSSNCDSVVDIRNCCLFLGLPATEVRAALRVSPLSQTRT
jgi:hypothetical protein